MRVDLLVIFVIQRLFRDGIVEMDYIRTERLHFRMLVYQVLVLLGIVHDCVQEFNILVT